MIICSCAAISDRMIGAAIAEGATSVDDIVDRCAAGARCGGCWPALERLLDRTTTTSVALADHAAA